jgi:hypothetical protein
MGYYIQTPQNLNKASQLAKMYGATVVSCPESFESIPTDKALLCLVDNNLFEAVGFCYSKEEFEAFKIPDGRRRTWMLMDLKKAKELTGFDGDR